MVTLRENAGSDILGQQTVPIEVEVPPHQTRAILASMKFPNLPYNFTQHAWEYDVTEIRGSKGADWVTPTATPSPKP